MDDDDPLSNPAREDALGGLWRGSDGDVFHPEDGTILVSDGSLISTIATAKQNIKESQNTLWRRIGPLRYGDI